MKKKKLPGDQIKQVYYTEKDRAGKEVLSYGVFKPTHRTTVPRIYAAAKAQVLSG